MNVLILDMIHGGDILAEEYLKKGYAVDCVDVYGTATQETKDRMNMMGVRVHRKVPDGHYDLLLMPVHCPDSFLTDMTYGERRTFHQAVGDLSDRTSRVEVTGVKGKTSFCYLLAHVLSLDGRSIFLHTSRGQGPWENGSHSINKKMSIAPTSLLRLPGGFDTVIAEVSLGGSGKASLTMITNLAEDYGIAANTRKASDAKASIFSDGKNIVPKAELGIWSEYHEDLIGYGGRIKTVGKPEIGMPLKAIIEYEGTHELELPGTYLHIQYIDTIDAVLETCHEMGIPAEQAIEGIRTFNGVQGRGEIRRTDRGWEITERNPGISGMSVSRTLDTLEMMNLSDDAMIILDPVNRKVCDKMDVGQIRRMAECRGAGFHLAGEGDEPVSRGVTVRLIKEGYQ